MGERERRRVEERESAVDFVNKHYKIVKFYRSLARFLSFSLSFLVWVFYYFNFFI